jgi:hypothetical protein
MTTSPEYCGVYLCGGCNAGEGSRGNASHPSFVGYRSTNPAALLDYRERYHAGGVARSFLNTRFQLLGRMERQVEATQVTLDTVRRQMGNTGRSTMPDFAGRIGKVWGQVGAVLGPAGLTEHVLGHIEHLRFYMDIVEDDAAVELSAWDWLVGRSALAATHALIDLRDVVCPAGRCAGVVPSGRPTNASSPASPAWAKPGSWREDVQRRRWWPAVPARAA